MVNHGWQRHDLERAVRLALDDGASLKTIGEAARDAAVRLALSDEGGDVARAAKRLRATTRTIASRTGAAQAEADTVRSTSDPPSIVEVPETALLVAGDPGEEPVARTVTPDGTTDFSRVDSPDDASRRPESDERRSRFGARASLWPLRQELSEERPRILCVGPLVATGAVCT